jgi:NTP pyrophosphatase (non-canonical NTP hydrolase)
MNLKQYQKAARHTAIYLRANNAQMIYPALGLVGECGEVAEKIKKLIRDDDNEMTPQRLDGIKKELGDVMWYCANICCDTDLTIDMVYEMKCASITHSIRSLILPRLVLCMNRHASAAAELLERWYYQYECSMTECDRFTELPNHLTHILVCINEIAIRCGFTLQDIYVSNIEKLSNRLKRNKVKGEGDER